MDNSYRIASDEVFYWLGRPVVEMYARSMLKMDVVRHAPLPDGPKIISANHPSTTDPFLILTLASEQVSILISETLFKVPLFGRYLQRAGHVPVVPGNGRAAFEKARQLIEAGRTVAVFPEGAISPLDGGFHKPHTGAARLSLITGAPVIPVGIHLQRERMRLIETMVDGKPEIGTWYLRGPYAMTVGHPMRFTEDVEDRAYVRSASERIMQHIAHLAHQSARRMKEIEATASFQRRRASDLLSTIRRVPATIGRPSFKR
jgi:1-acyl-sn-glycerol-3-phosphate acyltransferase